MCAIIMQLYASLLVRMVECVSVLDTAHAHLVMEAQDVKMVRNENSI